MNRNILIAAGVVMALAGMLLGGCGNEQDKEAAKGAAPVLKEVRWKMASAFAGTLPILGTGGVNFSKKVEEISSGRIQIKFFDPGKLVPALEVFDSTSKGAIDAAWSASGYWIGKIPASAFFSAVPFGPDNIEYLAWIYHGGGWDLWKELYGKSNIMPIPCAILPPEASGWFREPITDLEQFKGMKIRFYGIGGQVMQKLGASVQLLAGGDIFPALERGVLDATEFSMPSIDQKLGFYQIAKHYYFPGWHQQSSILELLINLDRWNELSKGDQALINVTCRDSILDTATLGEVQQGPALEEIKKHGVEIHYWSDEFLNGFKKAYADVVREMSAKDADFARVYQSYKEFRKNYQEWAKLSRLPAEF